MKTMSFTAFHVRSVPHCGGSGRYQRASGGVPFAAASKGSRPFSQAACVQLRTSAVKQQQLRLMRCKRDVQTGASSAENVEPDSDVDRVQAATDALLAKGLKIGFIRRAAAGTGNDVKRLSVYMEAMEGRSPEDPRLTTKLEGVVKDLEKLASDEMESSPVDRLRRKKDSRF
ncbi:hypothetical protein CYMTET_50088 [Cymbomonas tetramitiformis]|uniref:Uncharacterized protein n=1 Tax=Cymbomonas tetramitiformis TaxID=36881 RepID=A0AAE0BQ19_9CHLO|nr:hypothetical protein CYMTET_50088 [Cymbomonas tetramitiformis]